MRAKLAIYGGSPVRTTLLPYYRQRFGTEPGLCPVADEPYQRAHVTPYLYQYPEQFRLLSVRAKEGYHAYRWTVDTADDLQLVVAIYARLPANEMAHWREVVTLMKLEPELAQLNAHILQQELEQG